MGGGREGRRRRGEEGGREREWEGEGEEGEGREWEEEGEGKKGEEGGGMDGGRGEEGEEGEGEIEGTGGDREQELKSKSHVTGRTKACVSASRGHGVAAVRHAPLPSSGQHTGTLGTQEFSLPRRRSRWAWLGRGRAGSPRLEGKIALRSGSPLEGRWLRGLRDRHHPPHWAAPAPSAARRALRRSPSG